MNKHIMTATAAIALAANSFGAEWHASLNVAGPTWKLTTKGLEGKGPRYYDLPETALDGMEDGPYAYFQSRAVNLWQYTFLENTGGKDDRFTATVRLPELAPPKGFCLTESAVCRTGILQ